MNDDCYDTISPSPITLQQNVDPEVHVWFLANTIVTYDFCLYFVCKIGTNLENRFFYLLIPQHKFWWYFNHVRMELPKKHIFCVFGSLSAFLSAKRSSSDYFLFSGYNVWFVIKIGGYNIKLHSISIYI